MNHLQVSNLGPIKEADITFGDLTLLIGPQASGKSILLQLLKLLSDKDQVRLKTENYGYGWGKTGVDILNRYFGEGMAGIWNQQTQIEYNGRNVFLNDFLKEELPEFSSDKHIFYIPAQRIICLQNGWPRYFNDYDDTAPYIMRDFSESIRLFAEYSIRATNSDFSKQKDLNKRIKQSFDDSIFNKAHIQLDTEGKKRFKLLVNNSSIPFMVWSAGQKEFMPLLLSFQYLCNNKPMDTKDFVDRVILEEPEMGLHPKAIQSVMLQILDLMHRGYQVIVSTHSPVLLELLWALKYIKEYKGITDDLFNLFSLQKDDSVEAIFKNIIDTKTFATYFFEKTAAGVVVKNISSLDAGSDDTAVSEWGGLTAFSSKAVDIVSGTVSHHQ